MNQETLRAVEEFEVSNPTIIRRTVEAVQKLKDEVGLDHKDTIELILTSTETEPRSRHLAVVATFT